MNLDPDQSFRHSRAGKHAAAIRDGRAVQGNAPTVPMQAVSRDQIDRSTAPTVTLKTPAQKTYLGDGVYAAKEFGQVVLTTEDGVSTTNRIVLEPEVYRALVRYATDADTEKRS